MAEEKRFENRVKKFLKEQGCWYLKYWGGSCYTKAGIPDLLTCCNGAFVAVELKATHGRPSDLQLHTLKEIDQAGGYAVLLYPDHFELFKNLIRCICAGDMENVKFNYELLKRRWTNE